MQNSSNGKRARLSAEAATALSLYGARTTWPSGFLIYQKGSPADGLSVVLRGHVVLRNRGRSGKGFVPAIVTPGETFGVEGIAANGQYVTDACASEETETFYISGTQFRAFVRENPGQALDVIGQLMSERAMLLEKLHAMASQNVEQRLASALKRLANDKSFLSPQGTLTLELKHHRLLCEMVGATRESIALALGRLAASGAAERNGLTFIVAPSRLPTHITADGADGVDMESHIPVARESMTI